MSYTRAQFAAAVDKAHELIHEAGRAMAHVKIGHEAVNAIREAHEALHSVGAGSPRIECATHDPEAQKLHTELRALAQREIPCGHKIEDLVYGIADLTGLPPVTKCGACLAARQAAKEARA